MIGRTLAYMMLLRCRGHSRSTGLVFFILLAPTAEHHTRVPTSRHRQTHARRHIRPLPEQSCAIRVKPMAGGHYGHQAQLPVYATDRAYRPSRSDLNGMEGPRPAARSIRIIIQRHTVRSRRVPYTYTTM